MSLEADEPKVRTRSGKENYLLAIKPGVRADHSARGSHRTKATRSKLGSQAPVAFEAGSQGNRYLAFCPSGHTGRAHDAVKPWIGPICQPLSSKNSDCWNIRFVGGPALFQQQQGGGESIASRTPLSWCKSPVQSQSASPDRDDGASSSPDWTRRDQRTVIGVKTHWGVDKVVWSKNGLI
ncbi:hypothetical protein BJX63DRAFT_223274 [Aspergillus granulosus]|uniref:Uncharacterized protein n=1 Tax=Aspergillus granulosus TaxID=176169 RepID=A0ABR4I1R1_9EURO